MSQPPPAPPAIPDHVLLRVIGEGSYGEVWLARNAVGTLRAVKIIHRSRFDSARPYEREFSGLQKYEPLSRSHEGLMDVLHLGRNDQAAYFYYVMELADAATPEDSSTWTEALFEPRTLRSDIQRLGQIPPEACLRHFISLAGALEFLHRSGLIHRDVKPSNIIFVGGVAKLADIGLVAEMSESRSFVGTEGFIPLEGPGTAQADVYSLGKVLYEAATGLDRMEFPSLPLGRGELSSHKSLLELNAISMKACAPQQADRYQSAAEMMADLALLQSGRSVQDQHRIVARLRSALRLGRLALVAALVAAGVGTAAAWRARSERTLRESRDAELFEACIARAEAERRTGRAGAREAALASLQRAASLGRGDWARLRSEAITALTLPDFRPVTTGAQSDSGATTGQAMSGDFSTLAMAGADGRIRIRGPRYPDFDLGQEKSTPPSWVGPFSRDLRHLLVCTATRGLEVWKLPQDPMDPVPDQPVVSIAQDPGWWRMGDAGWWIPRTFTGNGAFLLAAYSDERLVWHSLTGETDRTVPLPGMMHTLAAHPTDVDCVVATTRAEPRISLVRNGRDPAVTTILMPGQSGCYGAAWNPAGTHFAVGRNDGRILIYQASQPEQPPQILTGHQRAVVSLAFHPSGSLLASSSWDGSVKLWSVAQGRELSTREGWGWDLQFSPDGKELALLEADSGRMVHLLSDHETVCSGWGVAPGRRLEDSAFSHDGSLLMVTGSDGVLVLDGYRGSLLGKLPVLSDAICPTANDTMVIAQSGGVHYWPFRKNPDAGWTIGPPVKSAGLRAFRVSSEAQSPAALLQHPDQGFEVRAQDDSLLRRVERRGLDAVTLSPDGRLAATVVYPAGLTIWETSGDAAPLILEAPRRGSVAFSPDSQHLFCSIPGHIRAWDISGSRNPVLLWDRKIPGDRAQRGVAAWSPDGTLIACRTSEREITLVKADSGEVLTLLTHAQAPFVGSLTFSPDSRLLLAGCGDAGILAWNLPRIRTELRSRNLDWNLPFTPESAASWPVPGPVRILTAPQP